MFLITCREKCSVSTKSTNETNSDHINQNFDYCNRISGYISNIKYLINLTESVWFYLSEFYLTESSRISINVTRLTFFMHIF